MLKTFRESVLDHLPEELNRFPGIEISLVQDESESDKMSLSVPPSHNHIVCRVRENIGNVQVDPLYLNFLIRPFIFDIII